MLQQWHHSYYLSRLDYAISLEKSNKLATEWTTIIGIQIVISRAEQTARPFCMHAYACQTKNSKLQSFCVTSVVARVEVD
jgi:hypothetical protein